jgi:ABC-type phosphate transport system substrate-binding protein
VACRRSVRVVPALVLGILFSASPARAQETYKVIVNVANPVEGLTKSDAARLFLTRTTWDTGEPAYPVDLAATSAVRQDFSRDVLGITTAAAVQQWKKASGEAPPAVATDREVLAFVRLKRGAIGYVSSAASVQGVKIVAIVKSPSR